MDGTRDQYRLRKTVCECVFVMNGGGGRDLFGRAVSTAVASVSRSSSISSGGRKHLSLLLCPLYSGRFANPTPQYYVYFCGTKQSMYKYSAEKNVSSC